MRVLTPHDVFQAKALHFNTSFEPSNTTPARPFHKLVVYTGRSVDDPTR